MRNIERVTAHLAAQAAGDPDRDAPRAQRSFRRATAATGTWMRGGETWRAYRFIENARTYETADLAGAGVPGGSGLRPLPAATCQPARRRACTRPSPTFTTRPSALPRWNKRSPAIAADVKGRAALAKAEIEFAARARIHHRHSARGRPCPSASPTTTPSSTTFCSTTPPAKASASSTSTP